MKKITYTLLFLVAFNIAAFAQAILPTSWSFATTTLPTGWTATDPIPGYYTASGNTPPAYKFDATGDKITIAFGSNPGNVTYYIAGNSFSGGTFLVEESVDGNTYTTLRSHTSLTSTYTMFTDVPNNSSRYIRFNYFTKVSGNVGLDDVSIAVGAAGPEQEINVKQSITTILNGGTYIPVSAVGVSNITTFTIENLGTTDTLHISPTSITGANFADFSILSYPSTVNPNSTVDLVVEFIPSVAGTRQAVLEIPSDDADEATYIVNLYGIGGTLATEPTVQATGLTFSNVKSYTLSASFTAASPAPEGYLVLRKTGSAITDVPTDGMAYDRGDMVGSSKVVYSGTATSFTPNNIVAGTNYYFAVFTYNGPEGYRNYLTTSPLAANVTSLGSMQASTYYNGINTSSSTFLTDLHNKINPHTQLFYSNYGPAVVNAFASRDTVDNQRVITCAYSGENKLYTEPFDWTGTGFSREHTFAHNWMPTNPAQELPEYEDYHHLFPTNQDDANAVRSNNPLGEVVNVTSSYLGCKYGQDAHGNNVFEPRDEHKGDAARAMMYVATCYTTVGGNSWAFPNPISNTIPYGQDQNILKTWNYQDPPDAWEIARNDFIESIQGNRNPFVDSIHFACFIDFTTMTKLNGPNVPCNAEVLSVADNKNNIDYMFVAPNPNNGTFAINYIASHNQTVTVKLIDVLGREVFSHKANANNGFNNIDITTKDLNKGIYLVELYTESDKKIERIVIK
ncbi:MAG: endonuclease [Bacteroidia bacterium]